MQLMHFWIQNGCMCMITKIEGLAGGTQSLFRALGLLKLVSSQHEHGVEVAQLVEMSGLDRTTAYRLLSGLVQAGFLEREHASKKYRLGIESMQLGLTAMSRAPILEKCRPVMQQLARQTDDTIFLVVRNGDYGHCLHLESGNFPIKAMTLLVGDLRLLGLGAAGRALLATRTPDEIESLYKRHRTTYDDNDLSLAKMRSLVTRIQKSGYAETESLINHGVRAVGVSFEITNGNYAAMSVGAIDSRMTKDRRAWIADLITEQVKKMGFAPGAQVNRPGVN
jgi:DNA-binding IclR family transcriptional regulator